MSAGEMETMLCLIRAVAEERGAVTRALWEFFGPAEWTEQMDVLLLLGECGWTTRSVTASQCVDRALCRIAAPTPKENQP